MICLKDVQLFDTIIFMPGENDAFESLLVQKEVNVRCPFCGERIAVLVDLSAGPQNYIEDCSVCCRPIQFNVHCDQGELDWVEAVQGD